MACCPRSGRWHDACHPQWALLWFVELVSSVIISNLVPPLPAIRVSALLRRADHERRGRGYLEEAW